MNFRLFQVGETPQDLGPTIGIRQWLEEGKISPEEQPLPVIEPINTEVPPVNLAPQLPSGGESYPKSRNE